MRRTGHSVRRQETRLRVHSYALIIGIDDYPPASGQTPLTSAATDARRMAAWLRKQDPSLQTWLLCAPHSPERNERPATRAAIRDALLELQKAGLEAGPDDRLYVFYAGHGIGYFHDQLLLLPQDTLRGALGETVFLWRHLESWLRTTGFRTQLCFLDTCRHEDQSLSDVWVKARLPVDWPKTVASDVAQYVLYATGPGKPASETDDAGVFTQALLEGLEGAADVSIHYGARQRVVRFAALHAYLEREVARRTQFRQQCLAGGQMSSNPIVAWLGPAGHGELRVVIEPPEAVASSIVEVSRENPPTPVDQRSRPPFHFDLLQGEMYTIVARASGYSENCTYSRVRPSPHIVQLRLPRSGEATLSGRDALVELSIEPSDPHLLVRLSNGNGDPIDLPPRGPRGYRLRVPPDRYRAVLITPERNIEQEFELRPGQKELIVPIPFITPQSPIDRLLDSLDRGESLSLGSSHGQAALLVLTEGALHPGALPSIAVEPLDGGKIRSTPQATLPSDIAELVEGTYIGTPGQVSLRLLGEDGRACQLLLPLLAGKVTIVGVHSTGRQYRAIELLLAPNPLRRRHCASQKRILWAQRFFGVERRSDVLALIKELHDEPLALTLAGYAALGDQDAEQARTFSLLLQTAAPDLVDGSVIFAAAERMLGRSSVEPGKRARAPLMLTGLQSQVSTGGDRHGIPSLTLRLLSRAVFNQIWLLIRGHEDIADSSKERIGRS
jgi:hypothetical protein